MKHHNHVKKLEERIRAYEASMRDPSLKGSTGYKKPGSNKK
jgi:hypothetical protein